MMKMYMKSAFRGVFIFFLLLVASSCNKENSFIQLETKSFHVPVLKNLKENPVLQMKLQINDSLAALHSTSITINLEGTSEMADIKLIRVWYSGNDSLFRNVSEMNLFGDEKTPATNIEFTGIQLLTPGDNYFWVSVELNEHANLHNQTGITLTKVEFSDNIYLEPNPEASIIKQRTGVAVRKHMDDNVNTYRIPGLATTKKGTLLAIYDARRQSSRDLQGDMDIGISRSTDGGNTWEPMRIGLDMKEWGGLPEKFNGVSDACILVDKNSDKIFLAGLWMHGVINNDGKWVEGLNEDSTNWNHQWRTKGSQPGFGVKQTSQFLIATSTDDGKTWSDPVNITKMCKKEEWWLFAPAPGQGITLEAGTLVFPTQGRDKNGETFSNITWSKDGGKSWTTSNPAYSNTTENMVVQLSDGSIMLNARYNENRNNKGDDNGRVVVTTTDLGKTWTEHSTSRSALIESTCMASIHKHVYHENGEEKSILIFSNPNTKTGRHNMTIKVSFDDGKTWPEEYWMLLDEGNSFGYSCLTSINENTIGILYEGSRAHMTFESILLKELIKPIK
jgi:sialidase-1